MIRGRFIYIIPLSVSQCQFNFLIVSFFSVGEKPLDLVLLFSSATNADKQKEMARQLVKNYVISSNITNVGLVTYGPAYTSLQLNEGISQTTVLDTIEQMNVNDGGSVNSALDYLSTSVFTDKKGARPGVPKQSIFFVDDVDFKDSVGVGRKIAKLKALGIKTLFIKVGDDKKDGDATTPTTPSATGDPDFADVFFFPDDLPSLDYILKPIVYSTGQGRL